MECILLLGHESYVMDRPWVRWDFIEIEGEYYRDMDRVAAFERALFIWAKWIDTNINPANTLVFFQGISPLHYNGTDWNQSGVKTCLGQRQPISGSTYPGGLPPALAVLKRALATIEKPSDIA
ncbi:Protein trichome birefringence-like 41 [Capsicum chinense]|nr:Protein trichome birefringence-like 41 [Capsicum chinense]